MKTNTTKLGDSFFTFLSDEKDLLSFENVVKQINAINKAIYGIEPYKVEESFEEKREREFKLTDLEN